ncbi:Hypothetical protein POVR2_LOCUS216 [uncultured virus]|nr:Hypothetical protein POVR2_LOCUS216 [uncultured virus]
MSKLYSWKDYARLTRRDEGEVFIEMIEQVDTSDIGLLDSICPCLVTEETEVQSLTHQEVENLYSKLVAEVLTEYI